MLREQTPQNDQQLSPMVVFSHSCYTSILNHLRAYLRSHPGTQIPISILSLLVDRKRWGHHVLVHKTLPRSDIITYAFISSANASRCHSEFSQPGRYNPPAGKGTVAKETGIFGQQNNVK